MPDSQLRDLLAAEAARLQPADTPEFADVLKGRSRHRAIAGAALAVLVVAATPILLNRHAAPPPDEPRAAPATEVAVAGRLVHSGGPMGTPEGGWPGRIRFEAANGAVTFADAGDDGGFRTLLAPGDYRISGAYAQYPDRFSCGTVEAVTVVPAAGLGAVKVVCAIR